MVQARRRKAVDVCSAHSAEGDVDPITENTVSIVWVKSKRVQHSTNSLCNKCSLPGS